MILQFVIPDPDPESIQLWHVKYPESLVGQDSITISMSDFIIPDLFYTPCFLDSGLRRNDTLVLAQGFETSSLWASSRKRNQTGAEDSDQLGCLGTVVLSASGFWGAVRQ